MPRIHMTDEGPNPVDTHIGERLRNKRILNGMSQEALARAIGITFQQVQKYEKGTNRISVSRLVDICKALKTPIEYFLDGFSAAQAKKLGLRGVSDRQQERLSPESVAIRKDSLELLRSYQNIKTPALKKQLLEMAKAMANTNDD